MISLSIFYYIVITILLVSIFLYMWYAYNLINYENNIDNLIEYNNKIIPSDLSDFCMQKILSKKEAILFAKNVKSHQKYWKTKNILMYILGTASYLEGAKGKDLYITEYNKTNKFLYKHYKPLYDKVLDYFQKRVPHSTVKYRFAYPGFHIFKCNKLFSLPVASVHIDKQYLNLTLNDDEDIDYDKTLSFTLCLELPPTGGGLYKFENNKKTKVIYKPGYIVCHNGKTSHMIAPSPAPNDDNTHYRITLQGHGLYDKKKNIWWLYW
jgi:hypothetical protein